MGALSSFLLFEIQKQPSQEDYWPNKAPVVWCRVSLVPSSPSFLRASIGWITGRAHRSKLFESVAERECNTYDGALWVWDQDLGRRTIRNESKVELMLMMTRSYDRPLLDIPRMSKLVLSKDSLHPILQVGLFVCCRPPVDMLVIRWTAPHVPCQTMNAKEKSTHVSNDQSRCARRNLNIACQCLACLNDRIAN